ncbi:hypothetical protein [Flavobacterium sp.]|uniref:hypothetical protein n=1 Tax=Flavobacterium sp. TaxID=239 RepID=UPI0026017D3C|nr:hypothetical protein [Flavobacterium sp.]
MKFFAKILLGIFILFQFSSIVVCLINERNENKIAINITEEEEHSHSKQIKEVKSEFIVDCNRLFTPFFDNPSKKIQDTYLLKNYAASSSVFIVPPEQV